MPVLEASFFMRTSSIITSDFFESDVFTAHLGMLCRSAGCNQGHIIVLLIILLSMPHLPVLGARWGKGGDLSHNSMSNPLPTLHLHLPSPRGMKWFKSFHDVQHASACSFIFHENIKYNYFRLFESDVFTAYLGMLYRSAGCNQGHEPRHVTPTLHPSPPPPHHVG